MFVVSSQEAMEQCPYDSNHRVPVRSMEKHKASCSRRKMGYTAEEEVTYTWRSKARQKFIVKFTATVMLLIIKRAIKSCINLLQAEMLDPSVCYENSSVKSFIMGESLLMIRVKC